jgi:hypothetical protein
MKQQEIHAGRILILLIVAYFFEERFPFIALFLSTIAIVITFVKINNTIKQENK